MTKMYNDDFDPLEDLESLKHNQMLMIKHINEQAEAIEQLSQTIVDLSHTVSNVIVQNAEYAARIVILEQELK